MRFAEFMLKAIQELARAAGRAAMEHYGNSEGIDWKADQSPLTLADRAAHRTIVEGLRQIDPRYPVLSEESDPAEVANRLTWPVFWLVDPLDGTKEFIKQTGEFTINIALIENHQPILGVVHAPVLELTWAATKGGGAVVIEEKSGATGRLQTRSWPGEKPVIVASRDHAGPQVEALFQRYPEASTRSMGSSLKFCLIAEGAADLYLRDVPTMEWDTGAAQAIVEEAGGVVTDLSGKRLTYNKANLRNPSLLTRGDPDFMPELALVQAD